MRQSITLFAPAAVISMALLSLALTRGRGSGPRPTATPAAAPAAAPVTAATPVTREVTVTRTVPVTVPVPVTRIVSSVREVPVTRIVPATVAVPVTREVPVTRIVTATPPPHTPTPDADAAAPPPTVTVATPMPTPASAPVLTHTPEPQPLRSIGNWQIYAKTYGDHTLAYAENQAIEYETDANPPILTYQRFRGQSSLSIEWQQRLFTRPAPAVEHRAQNPFEGSYDNNLDALVDYAREPHSYISKAQILTDYQRREVDDIWTDITRERNPDHDTPEALIETVERRSHRDLLIELSVTHENRADANNPDRKFRVPPHYHADYNWLVRSESKVQLYYGQVGSLKPVLRKSDSTSGSTYDVTLAAIVKNFISMPTLPPTGMSAVSGAWTCTSATSAGKRAPAGSFALCRRVCLARQAAPAGPRVGRPGYRGQPDRHFANRARGPGRRLVRLSFRRHRLNAARGSVDPAAMPAVSQYSP